MLFLVAVGAFSIKRFNATADDMYVYMLLLLAIITVILCIVLVALIRSGLGSFLTLLVVGGYIAFCVANGYDEEDVTVNKETVDAQVQQDNVVTIMLDKAVERFDWSWLVTASIPALLFALFSSIYAYRNFDDVVSRRFLYRNSNVSVFEVQWKYTFNRFYAGFMTVFAICLEIMIFIALKP